MLKSNEGFASREMRRKPFSVVFRLNNSLSEQFVLDVKYLLFVWHNH